MSRRALPARSTRGAKPVARSQEEELRDNALYLLMFGQDLDDEEDFEVKQARENQRKERTLRNLSKYSYARGYTYCFDLDKFPRLPAHPSYAVDAHNAFANTYRQEGRQYSGSALGSLMNRVYFGLPHTEHEQRRPDTNTKNICHHYLFENQDRKYHTDRAITTLKLIHRKWNKLHHKLKSFAVLKKDPELEDQLRADGAMEAKLAALERKIKALEERKAGNVNAWYYEDDFFLGHSRNQLLHDRIAHLSKHLKLAQIAQLYYHTEALHLQAIEQKPADATALLATALTYYNSQALAVSQEALNSLAARFSGRVLSLVEGRPGVMLPLQVFRLGSRVVREAVNAVIAGRVQQQSETAYFMAKFVWRRVFRSELPIPKTDKPRSEEVVAIAKSLVEEARHFYKQSPVQTAAEAVVDELVNWEQLGGNPEQRVALLREGEGVEVTGKELMLICVYDWLLRAYAVLLPFAERHPDLSLILQSDAFDKYSHGFVEATGSALLGTLQTNLELLGQVVARAEPILADLGALYFQWDESTGVGVLWRSKPSDEGWETEREGEPEGHSGEAGDSEEEADASPSKRVKENE